LSISGFSVAPNAGIAFFTLKPFDERTTPDLSGPAIAPRLNQKLGSVIQDAYVLAVPPPAVMGLGTIGGFKLYVEDRADLGYDALYQNVQGIIGQSYQTPGLASVFSMFTVNVPQLDADVDRVKAKTQGVPLQNLFETLQDLSRLAVCQRLQPLWPHLRGVRPGGRPVPRACRRTSPGSKPAMTRARWCRSARWSRSPNPTAPTA
jgi:multidrug efflux pump subunit AcrB